MKIINKQQDIKSGQFTQELNIVLIKKKKKKKKATNQDETPPEV